MDILEDYLTCSAQQGSGHSFNGHGKILQQINAAFPYLYYRLREGDFSIP